MAHLEVKPKSRSSAFVWIVIIILVIIIAAAAYYFLGDHGGNVSFSHSDTTKTSTP